MTGTAWSLAGARGRVRLFTRLGCDQSDRYPRTVEGMHKLRARSVTIDGEAVIYRADGISDFARLHGGAHDDDVVLKAFDVLKLDVQLVDLRCCALSSCHG